MSKTYIPAPLRGTVFDRAQGCCEYCLIPERLSLASHQVNHVIAEKHGGKTIDGNLALSCMLCNQAKGSDIASIDPETDDTIRLYHPRRDRWAEHFHLVPTTGMIQPLTAIGRVTAHLLQINRANALPVRRILAQANALNIPTL